MYRRPWIPLLLIEVLAATTVAAEPLAAAWDLLVAATRNGALPAGARLALRGAHGQTRSVLQTPLGSEAAFEVEIPERAVLGLGVAFQSAAFMTEMPDLAEPGRVEVRFEEAGGDREKPRVLVDRRIDLRARPEDRRWFDERIDIADLAGKRGSLIFRSESLGDAGKSKGTNVLWSAARLVRATDSGPSVLLITIDCLRADHVSSYGYEKPTTPTLDRLARDGVRFAKAYANAPMTLPSIPQLFTSRLFPTKNDPLLTTPIGRAGIASTAVINNAWIPLWLMQGKHADPPGTFDRIISGSLDATAITDQALAWLADHRSDRFLLYLHYLDAHTPYAPPAEYVERFADPQTKSRIGNTFDDPEGADQGRYGEVDRKKIVALYDAAIRYIDDQIARLLTALEESGRLDDTVIVITADHGEEFWDHGRFFHGQSLYDELLHVPLVVRLPGRRAAGTVVRQPVSLLSVAPSLVEWMGLAAPDSFEGASLETAIAAPDEEGPALLATATQPQFPTRYAIRRGNRKLIESLDSGRRELYDLGRDPAERRDLASQDPAMAVELAAPLDRARDLLRERGYQVRVIGPPHRAAEVVVQLESEPRSGTFLSVDRREPAGKPRLSVTPDGNQVRFETRAGESPSGFRFDRLRAPSNLSGTDRVKIRLTIDGKPAPLNAITLGATGNAPESDVLNLHDPELRAERAPPCPAPAEGVRVCLWNVPGEDVGALPEIDDPKVREKLRALGYVQ